ncbi:hypothetical protein C8F04DRAFT_1245481 [Mycena alexandri]|uniref:Uncharacterized protein n=1 Tax=Mycena alexandri TaxID=1745969 RepID=A0AAD6RVX2_9AGAR|nr:hypothetical protein C8F04DRAFT_1245481 [Mycena alexandri]
MAVTRETRRLFGRRYAPEASRNVRHAALLRKALELQPDEVLENRFGFSSNKLTVVMGTNFTENKLGTIQMSTNVNGRAVPTNTPTPPPEARAALAGYLGVYDVLFKKKGNDYAVRHAAAWPLMQAAEQTWHTFVEEYRATNGMGPRPDWAMEPLPGLQRVTLALPATAALVPIIGPTPAQTPPPRGHRRYANFPSLPSPPTSSPASSPTPASPPPTSSPARSSSAGPSSSPDIIDLTYIDDDEPRARPAHKRKFVHLGTIELTDDEEDEDEGPRKKAKFAH